MTQEKKRTERGWNLENSYANLPEFFFSSLNPTPVSSPKLVIYNHALASSLGLEADKLKGNEGVDVFAGNEIPRGSMPLAQAYAGHQFGHFTLLGDGRAILLGEQITPDGRKVDIQLKGAGRTPYSRGGDGRAGLGPMLREYIISEAMHGLGISTTRSLAVVTTGEDVIRETEQPGAVLTRTASSHVRVGTFQFVSKWGSVDDLQSLADYTLQRHFTHADSSSNRYLFLLQEVIKRQAELIAKWQLVGFIHGVMNTDNMSISGETIDYGPCAFMDVYHPNTVFSSIDRQGRYSYSNQPYIAGWNLARFAETLLPLLDHDQEQAVEIAQDAISEFTALYRSKWLEGMRAKLGLFHEEEGDATLIDSLLGMMQKYEVDYTNTFRALTYGTMGETTLGKAPEFVGWQELWKARQDRQQESSEATQQLMRNHNPAVIPRNHRVEAALEAAVNGDQSVMSKLLDVLSNPYAHSLEQEEYSTLPEPTNRPYQTYCGT
ncbi:protein adenylyltransferase SelO [Bacillus sp. FJAT-45037]|uniref:protein adenylyltransferase SelO n=1 Tax=Bacillus sp. FJAT-45037 TaxID=2011007 RepID=UPI000C24388F|nr:YdiU family protein [Bacillus sp. FJAT-45037]